MILNYGELLDRMQRALGARYVSRPGILNVPGKSIACRLDQNYYLVVLPPFVSKLSHWSAIRPSTVVQTLVKTGHLISRPPRRDHSLSLNVFWMNAGPQSLRIKTGFLLSDFIERALTLYADRGKPIPAADIWLDPAEKPMVEDFFSGKTPPQSFVYQEPVHDAVSSM